jgi:hypothetical protein
LSFEDNVDRLAAWKEANGRWPKGTATDPTEKQLARFLHHTRSATNGKGTSADAFTPKRRAYIDKVLPGWEGDPDQLFRDNVDRCAEWKEVNGRWPKYKAADPTEKQLARFLDHTRSAANGKGTSANAFTPKRRAYIDKVLPGWEGDPDQLFRDNVDRCAEWMEVNGRWPKRTATDRTEKQLASFINITRTRMATNGKGVNANVFTPKRREYLDKVLPGWDVDYGKFTKEKIIEILTSLGVSLSDGEFDTPLTKMALFTILEQKGVMKSKHHKAVEEILKGNKEGFKHLGADLSDPEGGDDVDLPPNEPGDDVTIAPIQPPAVTASELLSKIGAIAVDADHKTVNFLISESVAGLWKLAYAEDLGNIEVAPGESVVDQTALPQENQFAEMVRAEFRRQYDDAVSVLIPTGWDFRPPDEPDVVGHPNLMQRHAATLLRDRRRVGNWSGTGSGKTVSAILGARLIGAGEYHEATDDHDGKPGLIVVMCTNSTVATWASVIQDCFAASQVVTRSLKPEFNNLPSADPRWLVVNYDRLQSSQADSDLAGLLDPYEIDLVIVDEIHLAKQRDGRRAGIKKMSQRRRTILGFITAAGLENPDLAVLGMSATPVINDLREAVSLLEMIEGRELDDIATKPTLTNCAAVYRRMSTAGIRWVPQYAAGLIHRIVDVDATSLFDELKSLGKHPTPSAVERVLIDVKIPVVVEECVKTVRNESIGAKRKVLVYTGLVDGIVDKLTVALEAEGLRVGRYTGGDGNKAGLAQFTGISWTDGVPHHLSEDGQVDVLIGSSALSIGTDGLQAVADKLVFLCLPWTAAEYEQVIGRLHRTGQTGVSVEVVALRDNVDAGEDSNGGLWSWGGRMLDIIQHKQTVANAAVDGRMPDDYTLTASSVAQSLHVWIERLENEDGANHTSCELVTMRTE